MKTNYTQISLKEAQANFADLCNKVAFHRDVVIIKRTGGDDVALIAADELSGLIETLYLLRSPRNATRLVAAFKRARSR
jgi:antitoxin YefM